MAMLFPRSPRGKSRLSSGTPNSPQLPAIAARKLRRGATAV